MGQGQKLGHRLFRVIRWRALFSSLSSMAETVHRLRYSRLSPIAGTAGDHPPSTSYLVTVTGKSHPGNKSARSRLPVLNVGSYNWPSSKEILKRYFWP
jgi:hypothetical protein